jgi:mono/diheme cytochrome c family protein
MRVVISLVAGMVLSTQGHAAEATDQGRLLLEKNCSRCHAIGRADASPNAQAPPFRSVIIRYPAEYLAEALAEGIMTRHSEMPEFIFAPDEIEAIVAYLNTLGSGKVN